MFEPIKTLLAPHFGIFWEKVRSHFPICQEVAPLGHTIEQYGEQQVEQPTVTVQLLDRPPLPRIWFTQKAGNALIQVQPDWFLYNWKKVSPDDEYPRYTKVANQFSRYYSDFCSFISDNELGQVSPKQFELQYVNHILLEEGWSSLEDISEVFPDFAWRRTQERNEKFLPTPEAINWQTSFVFPDQTGRLNVSIRTARRGADQHPLIRLDLRARGMSQDASEEAMWSWFDTAHEWIVKGFADMTGTEIQDKIWRRLQ